MVDSEQTENPDVPVVIVGLGAYAGKGAWAKQLMVDNLMLTNRGASEAITVKLGWSIVDTDMVRATMNRNSPLLRKSSLLEGFIELPTSISPGKMQTLRDLQIDFVKRARELIRSAKLKGEAVIRLRVAEATFMNGSVWNEQTEIAKSRNHRYRPTPPPPGCPNRDCFFENNGQGYCTFVSLGFYCKRINCAIWDPAARSAGGPGTSRLD